MAESLCSEEPVIENMNKEDSLDNFYELEYFRNYSLVIGIQPYMICKLCNQLMENASQLIGCGCGFYLECIKAHLLTDTKCPNKCVARTGEDFIVPDCRINKEIRELNSQCSRCQKFFKMALLKNHISGCENTLLAESNVAKLVEEVGSTAVSESRIPMSNDTRRMKMVLNDSYMLRIRNFATILVKDRNSERIISHFSDSFYIRSHYKAQITIYPNGRESGRNSHVSLFLVIKNGRYDDYLEWPFNKIVKFSLHYDDGTSKIRSQKKVATYRKVSVDNSSERGNVEFGIEKFIAIEEVNKFVNKDEIAIEVSIADY